MFDSVPSLCRPFSTADIFSVPHLERRSVRLPTVVIERYSNGLATRTPVAMHFLHTDDRGAV